MDEEQIRAVIEKYRQYFEKHKIEKADYPRDEVFFETELGLSHCHGMLDKMEEFLRGGRKEKVMRWLGFVQAVLWSSGIYTIDELARHNKPRVRRNKPKRS